MIPSWHEFIDGCESIVGWVERLHVYSTLLFRNRIKNLLNRLMRFLKVNNKIKTEFNFQVSCKLNANVMNKFK